MSANQQVVLITGATGTLGRVVTRIIAEAGYRLTLVARQEPDLISLATGLGLSDDRLRWHAADLTVPERCSEVVGHIADHWGRVDCLLHLMGTWQGGVPLAELADDRWQAMLAVNLHSALYITRAVLPIMLAQRAGRIVYIGSRAVERPGAGQAHYNVSKAGLVALARSVAADYARQGIRANVVHPGTIMVTDSPGSPLESPSGGVSPEALAHVLLMLCGPAGANLNGASIPVYGGSIS